MSVANIFVIVPVYNDQDMLRTTVLSLLNADSYNVVVVDDGSNENPVTQINDLPVHFLQHPVNLGQGSALQTGTEYALKKGADYVVHFDADGQHSAEDIKALIAPLISKKIDICFGSRFLSKEKSRLPLFRRIVLNIARYLNFCFTGFLLTDAHNGMRAMTKFAAAKIVIRENRMAHASEILFLVKKHKLMFTEAAVRIHYSTYSKQKGQSSWNSIRIFFDLLLHKLFE